MIPRMEVIYGGIKAEWVDLNEGWEGEYDPSDADDVHFLRFDVLVYRNDEWVDPGKASYCTRMPANSPPKMLMRALCEIAVQADNERGSGSLKRRLQELSWLCPEDFVGDK